MMDSDEWWDADVTGDPQLDEQGYESPKRVPRTWAHPQSEDRDWLAASTRDRARREAKWGEERRRRESPPAPVRVAPPRPVPPPVRPVARPAWTPPPMAGPEPGQHGAYFERRAVRVWWAPWRRRYVWQQISTWQMGLPPSGGTEVVTVADVAQLPGVVRTIGTVGPSGAVVY